MPERETGCSAGESSNANAAAASLRCSEICTCSILNSRSAAGRRRSLAAQQLLRLGHRRLAGGVVAQQQRGQRAGIQRGEPVVKGIGTAPGVIAPARRCCCRRRPSALASIRTRARAPIKRMLQGVGRRRAACQGESRARFADALHRQRVAAQVGEGTVVVHAVGGFQLLEHAGHARGCVAGIGEHAEADTIGLTLHVARVVQLALHGGGLRADHRRLRGIGVAGLAGGQHAQDQPGQAEQRGALRVDDAACDVPLRDVRQLVRQHRGQLVARRGDGDQPEVHADKTAGQCKGVDAAVAHQEDLEGQLLRAFRR